MYNSILQYLQELAIIIAEKANYENLQDIDRIAGLLTMSANSSINIG